MLEVRVESIACYMQTLIIQSISARRSAAPKLGHHRSLKRWIDHVDICRGALATTIIASDSV